MNATVRRRAVLSTGEVAELLHVSKRSVLNWAASRGMPSYATPGGHLRFRPHELVRWLRDSGMDVPEELA